MVEAGNAPLHTIDVPAEAAGRLEERYVIGARQDVARREPADAAADDGDPASGHPVPPT